MHAASLRTPPVLALTFLLGACGGGGGGGGSSPVAPPPPGRDLGDVTVISASSCPSGPGTFANTLCMQLGIDGLGIASIEVELRITPPDPGSTPRGTIVMGSGFMGNSFYADELGGDSLVPSLTAAGFRVVDRSWINGWFADGVSLLAQSGRYATLITWVKANLHDVGIFSVTGNSAGAGEIAYALSRWQRADIIDLAVLTSGPPFSLLEFICLNPPSDEWLAICRGIIPPGVLECGEVDCVIDAASTFCLLLPTGQTAEELQAESIMSTASLFDFPNTMVHCILAAQDCSIAVPMGLAFMNAVSSPKLIEFAPATPHLVPSTAIGRAAILQAFLDNTPAAPGAPSAPDIRSRVDENGNLRQQSSPDQGE